uniref:Uncharacterized protein n=1 Tax=Coccolithus braarudii TaxID=221442 RepID=A0A7S0PXQ7_9EUKA
MNTLEKLAILTEVRMLHALDGRFTHSWKERAALIVKDKMAQKTYQSYPNYPDEKDSRVKEFCKQAHSHLALFKKKKAPVHVIGCWRLRKCLPTSGGTSTAPVFRSSGM